MKKTSITNWIPKGRFLFIALLTALSMSLTSCSKDNDKIENGREDPDPPTPTSITVTNTGTYTLSRFRIIFLNSSREKLSEKDCGTLAPNDRASAKIPTAAKEYYMATYLSNKWFFSPYYDITYYNLSLSDSEIGEWRANN